MGILEFTSFAITVKFTDALYRFLGDMIGLELVHIINISKQVGAFEIYEQVSQHLHNIVPIGYIAICHNCKVGNRDTKMLVVGELSKDYEYFYNKISMI